MSVLEDKSYKFAIRIVKLNQYLANEKKEYVLILRSGTSIGAVIAEAKYAQSKADFVNKLQISLKEANETQYWIRLLKDCDYLSDKMFQNLIEDIEELIKILISSINTTKKNNNL